MADIVRDMLLDVANALANHTAEQRGEVVGFIAYNVALAALTAGVGQAAQGGALAARLEKAAASGFLKAFDGVSDIVERAAKLLRKLDKATPDEAFHYTSKQWADAIKREGLRPGTYATLNGNLGGLQAQLELALPPNRAAPNIRIRIDIEGLRKAGYEIPTPTRISSTVRGADGRVYQMPGGGWEMKFPYEIPPEFLEVLPIK